MKHKPGNRPGLKEILTGMGHEVVNAGSAEEAERLIDEGGSFDVILVEAGDKIYKLSPTEYKRIRLLLAPGTAVC